jgi:hypothetical protein
MTAVRPAASMIAARTDPETLLQEEVFWVLRKLEHGHDAEDVIALLQSLHSLETCLEIESQVAERSWRPKAFKAPKNCAWAMD